MIPSVGHLYVCLMHQSFIQLICTYESLLHVLVLGMYRNTGNYGFLFSVLWFCFCNRAGGPVLCGLCIHVLTTLIGDG